MSLYKEFNRYRDIFRGDLAKLRGDQQRLAHEHDFDGAEAARLKIRDTFIEGAKQQLEEMTFEHERQLKAVNDSHAEELSRFQRHRERKLLAFQIRAKEEQQTQLEHQALELDMKKVKVAESVKFTPHTSKPLLDLRACIDIAIEADLYVEAKTFTRQVEMLQHEEELYAAAFLERKLKESLDILRTKHWEDNQLLSRRQKQEEEELEVKLTRQLNVIVQRYKNVISDLKTKQNIQWTQLLLKLQVCQFGAKTHYGDFASFS